MDVGHRIERVALAHVGNGVELVLVHPGHHLHQPLRAHRAFGKRVVARLDGDHGQQQQRIELFLAADLVDGIDQHRGRVIGHLVLARDIVAQCLHLRARGGGRTVRRRRRRIAAQRAEESGRIAGGRARYRHDHGRGRIGAGFGSGFQFGGWHGRRCQGGQQGFVHLQRLVAQTGQGKPHAHCHDDRNAQIDGADAQPFGEMVVHSLGQLSEQAGH